VLGSDACYREWAYVALSRARAGSRLYLVGDPDSTTHGFAAALQTSRVHELANEHGEPAPAPNTPDPRSEARAAAVQRRLAPLDHAIEQAREGHHQADQRLIAGRSHLEQLGSGLGKLTRRDQTTRLRRDVARLEGDVAAWQQRLDDLTAQRTALSDKTSPVPERQATASEPRSAERPTAGEVQQRSAAVEREHGEEWDIGIA
jgi:chromosome segregation ATPase